MFQNLFKNLFKKDNDIEETHIVYSEPEELKVNRRLLTLIERIADVNPSVKEIIKLENPAVKGHLCSVQTTMGKRYITITKSKYQVSFFLKVYENIEEVGSEEPLFGIEVGFSHSVNFNPSLHEGSSIGEEQIYLFILELEQIFEKYNEKTLTEANRKRTRRFIERFD